MLAAQPTPHQRMMGRSNYTQEAVDLALAEYARAPSIALRNKIVLCHMRAAVKLASKYYAPGMELDDWVAYAVLGLIRAVELFDAANGATFLTYASFRMRAEMTEAYRSLTSTIRVPRSEQRAAKHGDAEAAEGIARVKFVESSDAVNDNGQLRIETDVAFAADEASAYDKYVQAQLQGLAQVAAQGLDNRSRTILLGRAGGQTLQELADQFSTSRQRVQQLEVKAREATREAMARLTGEYVCSGA